MDRLQGYNTTGYEYRMSQIDRSNSKRLKWMMNEAKKNADFRDNQGNQNEKTNAKGDLSTNNIASLNKNMRKTNDAKTKNNMFHPDSVNKFKHTNINNPFNKF